MIGPKQPQLVDSESQTSEFDTCDSNISTEPSELVSGPVVNESNIECQPKVWSDAPIIEEYESDSKDEYVTIPPKEQETLSFANKQVKTPRETIKNQFTHSQKPKVDKKELGVRFTVRACFVCGSLNHLIRDCDFHEKRMARKAELNSGWNKKSSQRELRQTWNNVQRVNKQNQFVPSAVLTRTGKIPVSTARTSGTKNVSTARQSFNRQTVLTSTAMKVNTVKPIVNRVRPANVFHKTHSPYSRPFKKTTVLSTDFSKQKVNTAKENAVSTVGGKRETAVKPSAGCNWRPQRYNWHNDYPHRALKNKGIVDSGCSRHMTGNKAYLAEFQDFNGGPVAFGGSKGYITVLSVKQHVNHSSLVPDSGKVGTARMAVLDSCRKHNMVAYLEKSEGNAEFHEIIDFLMRSSIHHALTVSPVVSTTFVEQFWTSAKSKMINNVRHITAKVAGKPVSISEASIRSDLLFDDANGIDSLPNQAIFDAIQLMSKVFSFMIKKGKHFLGKVTPLFASMLVQPTEDEGAPSERPSKVLPIPSLAHTSAVPIEPQTDSSPAHTSEVPIKHQIDPSPRPSPSTIIPDSIPESSSGNLRGHSSSDKSLSGYEGEMTLQSVYVLYLSLCAQVSDQAKEIQHLKAQIKKLKKQAKPVIKHHRAWMQSVSLKHRLARKISSKKQWVHKESIPEDTLDHMETEDAQIVGRTRDTVGEEKEIDGNILSTEDVLSTDKEKVSIDKEKVSTDRPIVSTDGSKVSIDRQIEGTDEQIESTEDHTEEGSATQATQTPTSTIFGDDETIAKVLLNMSQAKAVSREKEKGVELKDIEETDSPRPTSTRSLLTLKPLPRIDPKDKGKKKIEEEDESESESDEEWEGEEERNRIAEEKAANEALIRNFDDIKARIKADRLLAKKLQEEEREQFYIKKVQSSFIDTMAAPKKILVSTKIRSYQEQTTTKNPY
ncbi:hypothetical protein Tco_0277232 [Tanacetum coccineum]